MVHGHPTIAVVLKLGSVLSLLPAKPAVKNVLLLTPMKRSVLPFSSIRPVLTFRKLLTLVTQFRRPLLVLMIRLLIPVTLA